MGNLKCVPGPPAPPVAVYIFCCQILTSTCQVVSQRFPQNSIGAVGSAMFLRFINPAIVSPYETGILDKKPPPRIERGLKLMSKVRTGIWSVRVCVHVWTRRSVVTLVK